MDLFEFNDDFIALTAGGMDDEDVLEMFVESTRAGADVLEKRLLSAAGPEIVQQTQFVDGTFVIPLTEEQFNTEYGDADTPPQANIRRAIIGSVIPGSMEMSRMLSGD